MVPVACLRDNYSYLVYRSDGDGQCLIVDASEASPVAREVTKRGLVPCAILTTHHHHDHVGGNVEISRVYSIPIYGHERERHRIPGMTHGVEHQQQLTVGEFSIRTLHAPGHTQSGVCYDLGEVCFTGDTLFCGGCGRLLEGTASQLHHSLTHVLRALPDETQVYVGHEYSEANLRFAVSILPNEAILDRFNDVVAARNEGRFCASASLSVERGTNLFLNCHRPEVQQAVLGESWAEHRRALLDAALELLTFTELRRLKDQAR